MSLLIWRRNPPAAGTPPDDVPVSNTDPLPISPKQYTSAPSSAAILTAAGDVATLAAGEKLFIQNLGTNPLYVRRATGASTTAFHYALVAGGANDDGTGGAVEVADHVGVVSVAGTSPRFIAWKVS